MLDYESKMLFIRRKKTQTEYTLNERANQHAYQNSALRIKKEVMI